MSILTDIFAAQGETPDLAAAHASVADVIAAAAMIGWLSDPDARWIPLAIEHRADA